MVPSAVFWIFRRLWRPIWTTRKSVTFLAQSLQCQHFIPSRWNLDYSQNMPLSPSQLFQFMPSPLQVTFYPCRLTLLNLLQCLVLTVTPSLSKWTEAFQNWLRTIWPNRTQWPTSKMCSIDKATWRSHLTHRHHWQCRCHPNYKE